ncbi:MAG: HAMP domain-containing histidine kinase [Bacteriovoracaceae bacterium]|nr:HAMP domain-containing histidine kinase [Bacteriovoracaceae bacterium]
MKSNKLILLLSSFWAFSILALGVWWLYLINKLSKISNQAELPNPEKLNKMVLWEGGTFVVLLILISCSLLFYYLKDQGKTKSLQVFFAGLTHELKTPLASIRLQADVISNFAEKTNSDKLMKLTNRMVEDTQKLEVQMDKILQLSRLQQGGILNPTQINPEQFLKFLIKSWSKDLSITITNYDQITSIMADEFALQLILNNLLENTKNHVENKNVSIQIKKIDESVLIEYQDQGVFEGNPEKMATLFYKFNSSRGSGIGLYLCKKMMERMNGKMKIITYPRLKFQLYFKGRD